MTKETKVGPLTAKHRIGYALGDLGGCMTFSLMSAFMTRYYVNVALMDTAVIAVMTLIWKIFDALGNPVIGMMMDKSFARSKGNKGKFRPWICGCRHWLPLPEFWCLPRPAGYPVPPAWWWLFPAI